MGQNIIKSQICIFLRSFLSNFILYTKLATDEIATNKVEYDHICCDNTKQKEAVAMIAKLLEIKEKIIETEE